MHEACAPRTRYILDIHVFFTSFCFFPLCMTIHKWVIRFRNLIFARCDIITYLCCAVCAAIPIQMPSNLSPVAFCRWLDSRPPNTTPARQPSGELLIFRSKCLINFCRPNQVTGMVPGGDGNSGTAPQTNKRNEHTNEIIWNTSSNLSKRFWKLFYIFSPFFDVARQLWDQKFL